MNTPLTLPGNCSTDFRLLLLGLFALPASCGSGAAPDPMMVPLAVWPAAQAAILCQRIATCCDSSEKAKYYYVNDAQCRQMQADLHMGVNNLVAQGLVVYDANAARRCLDEMKAISCADLFNDDVDMLAPLAPSCSQVATGTLRLGESCDVYPMFCASGNCVLETRTCGPALGCPASCAAAQYCDEAAGGCVPLKADGSACDSDAQCTSPSVCRMLVCGAALPDGAACSENAGCTSGHCLVNGCGQPFPNGAACAADRDCSSGACVGDPNALACGPPLPDGSGCKSNAQCTSGNCALRAATGVPTCGPVFCDGV
jgi:hypothetical protein